ncbi:MAG TPA: SusC/RagA family TonB-linked outer membrane protein [Cyclobacteriaceae bacterium]|nr:SusC/RagA family TonB-linked outer membrane protein [Cyclobacteriaceae bacterium]HRK53180.1 SusC/RagA family TonB-linked outer membrane protein [Cyclobacteriaceae bacterium]
MKKFLLLCFSFVFVLSAWAQERVVSGRVTAADDGSTLPGVNVILKGTANGTVTDVEGNYRLNVPSSGGTLVFSFIGLQTLEVAIGERSTIDLSMAADVRQLTEVVVTAVGIEQNKRTLGYSVQNVKADDIVNARETNLLNALNSKVAGVSVVSSSGAPGASSNVRIRGNTSINGSNSPLFVVDGVPIDNSTGGQGNGTGGVDNSNRAIDINSNDIESLTVLKGASATVLYGIRAANGAIIITTKKGKSGKPQVDFNTTYTLDQVNKLPEFQMKYAQGRPVGGVNTWRGPDTFEGNSYGPAIADLEFDGSVYPFDKNGKLVPKGTGNGVPARSYNNTEDFFITGQTWDKNISVSGGTDKSTYYLSFGNLKTSGIIPNSEWERTTTKLTTDTKITDKLTAGMSATFSNTGGSRLQRGSNISGVALGLYRNTPTFDAGNGKTGQEAADDPSTYELPDGSQRSYRAGIYDSPYWTVAKNQFDDNVNRIIGNVNLKYEITPWLQATYKIGLDHYTDKTKGFADVKSAAFPTGTIVNLDINSTDINSDLLFIVNKDINEDLNLNAVFGHNYYTFDYYTDFAQGTDFGSPGFSNISNAATVTATEGWNRKKINGVMADIKFDYRNFLFLNLTGRNDWSSTLPSDNNSFFYPAAALGVDVTEAFGIGTNSPFLSYAKLRGSWGQVGNDAPTFVTRSYFNSATAGGDGFIAGIGFPAFGTNAFERSNTLGNDKLKAELTTTYEFGGEFKFFNGRLGFDYTYYNSETVDQIININISNTTGFGGLIANAGTIENKGHELLITGTPVKAGDFSWNIEVNFTKYESLVKELAPGTDRIFLAGFTSASSNVIAGKPYGAIYGNAFQRNDEGKLVIGPNGWPNVDPAGDKYLGDPTPDWIAGIRNTFSFKGLSLSALLDIRQGGDIWNGTGGILNTFGTSKKSGDERETRGYVFDGVLADANGNPTEGINNIPVDFANPADGVAGNKWNRYGFGGLVEENIQDGSWIRLRQLTLAYQIPPSILSKLGISKASFSVQGRNLWLKTDYDGIDPETNLTGASNGIGLDYFNMPNTKSYGATLNVTF